MRVEFTDSFVDKLNHQVAYIAKDKPGAARKFKNDILQRLKKLVDHPFRNRRSIYFDNDHVRDMTYKGYTLVYKVDQKQGVISVFALLKHEDSIKP